MSYLELAKKVVTERRIATSTQPVSFETLEAVFQETLDRANTRCVEDPSLLDRYDAEGDTRASNHLNQVWKACLEGKATLRDFREAVAAWERAVLPETVKD